MEADGADLIDIGGESTRPGAEPVGADEEAARILPVVGGADRTPPDSRLRRHLQGVGRRRGARAPAPRWSTTSAACCTIRRWRRGCGAWGGSGADAHTGASQDDVRRGRLRGRGCRRDSRARGNRWPARPPRVCRSTARRRSWFRVCQTAGAQLWCAGAAPRDRGGPRPAGAGRAFAQVVSAGSRRRDARRAGRDWTTAAAVTAAVLNGAHIVRVHAVAEMVQVVRTAEEIRRAQALVMNSITTLPPAPSHRPVGPCRHPRGVGADLRRS